MLFLFPVTSNLLLTTLFSVHGPVHGRVHGRVHVYGPRTRPCNGGVPIQSHVHRRVHGQYTHRVHGRTYGPCTRPYTRAVYIHGRVHGRIWAVNTGRIHGPMYRPTRAGPCTAVYTTMFTDVITTVCEKVANSIVKRSRKYLG